MMRVYRTFASSAVATNAETKRTRLYRNLTSLQTAESALLRSSCLLYAAQSQTLKQLKLLNFRLHRRPE